MKASLFAFTFLLSALPAMADKPDLQACFAAVPEAVATNLADLALAKDKSDFCPAETADQKCFESLVKATIQAEHEINPTHLPPFKSDTRAYNVGCLHLAPSDRCEGDITNPVDNLTCGVRLLAKLIKRDGVISLASNPRKGGAAYWSVLREPHRASNGGVLIRNNMRVKMLIGDFLREK